MESMPITRSRREFLVDGHAEALRITGQLLDWRAAAVALLLAGIGAGALSLVSAPPYQALVFLVYSAVLALWSIRRSQLAKRSYFRLEQLSLEDTTIPPDRESTRDLPLSRLTPSDVQTIDELDRFLRLRKDDRAAALADARAINTGVIAFLLVAIVTAIGLVVAIIPITTLVHLTFPAVGDMLFLAAAGAPGILLYREVSEFLEFNRSESSRNLVAARVRLAELAAAELAGSEWTGSVRSGSDPGSSATHYLSGEVIRWTGNDYVIDPARMTISPVARPLLRIGSRVVPWALLGAVVCLALVWAAEAALHSVTQFLF